MGENFITRYRPLLIEELQKEVPIYLTKPEVNIITRQEYEKITSYEKRESRITYLLEILSTKTLKEKTDFQRYVGKHYPWIINHNVNAMFKERKEFIAALDEGEVPPLPYRHVERENSIQLLQKLYAIKRNEYVVLHGMRGCGKSTLVSSVLYGSPSLVMNYFGGKVFWLSIGDTDEFTLQLDLCGRLSPFHSISPLPEDCKHAKRFLKDKFSREEMCECLLILDDVRSASYLHAFDVGCKILITTDDVNVMEGCKKRFDTLKISEGFTESETMELFSDSIQVEKEKLPRQAKKIHAICKGFPLTISLISSQLADNKDEVTQHLDRWKMYETKLKQDGIGGAVGPYDRSRSKRVTLLRKAIGLSIDSLDQELKQMYLKLALFMEDVNIRPEVLSILWAKSKQDVIDIMQEFEKKTLVHKIWSSSKKTFIYCVHDLLLGYLKSLLNASDRKELHQKFIECYQEKYGKNFNDFPVDDNYILLYLGYHLIEADMADQFPGLYLNLKFIEKKILHYGFADLLFDLKKYKDQIAHNEANSKKYEDFTHFIRRVAASCRPISNCNIVQFGLFECKDSEVYKAACELKHQEDPSYLVNDYFELLTQAPVENSPSVVPDRDEIVSAAFTQSGDVLVANSKGVIRRLNVHDDHIFSTKTFEGHRKRVTILQVKNSFFLSASDDATVRVWNANGSSGGSGDFENRRTPSPQMKQTEWHDMFGLGRSAGEKAISVLQHGVPIKCARFSNNPTNWNIVTIDVNDKLRIFLPVIDTEDRERTLVYPVGKIIRTEETGIDNCSFSNDDSLVLYTCSGGNVCIHSSSSGELIKRLNSPICDVKSMIIVPESSHITAVILGDSDFSVVKIDPVNNAEDYQSTFEARYESSYDRKRKDNFVCAAVSWDGKYVAIATTNNNIFIYNTVSGEEVLKLNECNGKINGICWSLKNDVLLTTYERGKIMKKWIVHQDGKLSNSVKLRQHAFDAVWTLDDIDEEETCVAAVLDNRNYINVKVFFNFRLERELNPTKEKISHVCVCPSGGDIVYTQENGHGLVTLINTNTNEWTERTIFIHPYRRVFTVKAFGAKIQTLPDDTVQSLTLVVILGQEEETDTKFGFMGWKRSVIGDKETKDVLRFKPLPQHAVRDLAADLKNDELYVVTVDHVFHVYDLLSGNLKREEDLGASRLDTGLTENMKYCDISSNFAYIMTGTEKHHFLRTTSGDLQCVEWKSETEVRTCKFSPNAKYLVLGFEDSNIEVYEVESLSNVRPVEVNHPYKFSPGSVLDITWSPSNDRFIVIFEREVSLYKVLDNKVEVYAIAYMSVDKLVSDAAFTRSATVDSGGHYRVLQHPF